MLPVFITTLAIEISSIVIIAAFCLFEDDVGLLDEEVIVTGAQFVHLLLKDTKNYITTQR